jgi:hypothetical protein
VARPQQFRQLGVAEDVIDALAAILLALEAGELFRRLVAHDDFVEFVEDDRAVGHRIRGLANLFQQAAIFAPRAVSSFPFEIESREHLLPDALADPEFVEISRVQRSRKGKQLPHLPEKRDGGSSQQPPDQLAVKPADQRTREQDHREAEQEFPGRCRHTLLVARRESVARSPDGLDVGIRTVLGERFSQTAHMHVYCTLFHIDVRTPHPIEQLRATVNAVGMSHQEV